jgi:hypothetical protein
MTYIKWRKMDGRHSSYASSTEAPLILEMIETDPTMALIEVQS